MPVNIHGKHASILGWLKKSHGNIPIHPTNVLVYTLIKSPFIVGLGMLKSTSIINPHVLPVFCPMGFWIHRRPAAVFGASSHGS